MYKVIRPNKSGFFMKLVGENIRCFVGAVALGNSTQFRIGLIKTAKGIFVGVENNGSYEFQNIVQWGYLQVRLKVHEQDAKNLADFINDQLYPGFERQGDYKSVFCDEHDDIDVEA